MIEMTAELLLLHMKDLLHSPYIHGLFWLILLDIATGYLKAFKLKQYDSKISTNGLLRHILVFVVMIIIGTYARALGYKVISIGVSLVFIGSYGTSLLENWQALGLPFKDEWKIYFEQMKKSKNQTDIQNIKVENMEVINKGTKDENI